MTEIKKVAIVNRGEIALRIIRTCKERGIRTVALFSEADAAAPHVLHADESILIGGASPAESYLNIPAVIEAVRQSGADTVHPGYGFLSENPGFAKACEEEGIRFAGPSPEVIALMGDKTRARQLVTSAGVACPPGSDNEAGGLEEASDTASSIGYPVLIKAAAGGGGKGMRIIRHQDELEQGLKSARSEAKGAFGDDRIFIEKYLEEPRHIEIQILADSYGNVVHLFERECSVQRRHQKVIEEAPSPLVDEELRKSMAETAILIAKLCRYEGAGTVEFLVDKQKNFYFLEMNTRLQVEHPVTELITGLDLVALQLDIAAGKKLPFSQTDLKINGHAIECRIYAEDPDNNFLPDTGLLNRHRVPGGPGVRMDAGIEEGQSVTIHYDPMISKLSVHAATRELAIAKMSRALDEYEISGVRTTIPFCKFTMQERSFADGSYHTGFVKEIFEKRQKAIPSKLRPVAALISAIVCDTEETETHTPSADGNGRASRWWQQRKYRS